jgi:hypothetical protein
VLVIPINTTEWSRIYFANCNLAYYFSPHVIEPGYCVAYVCYSTPVLYERNVTTSGIGSLVLTVDEVTQLTEYANTTLDVDLLSTLLSKLDLPAFAALMSSIE